MVTDQVLRPLDHPCQIADTQLAALVESGREREPSRVTDGRGTSSGVLRRAGLQAGRTQGLRPRYVEAQEVAAGDAHGIILTIVELTRGAGRAGERRGPAAPVDAESPSTVAGGRSRGRPTRRAHRTSPATRR